MARAEGLRVRVLVKVVVPVACGVTVARYVLVARAGRMGVVVAVVVGRAQPGGDAVVAALLSPLLGTGMLGGFTTFAHYTDDVRQLFEEGSPGYAIGCLVLTVVAALAGVTVGALATHAALGRRNTSVRTT